MVRLAGRQVDANRDAIQKTPGRILREVITDEKNQFVLAGAEVLTAEQRGIGAALGIGGHCLEKAPLRALDRP